MHFDIMKYGAVPDGKALSTQAIAEAIDACSKAGGGTVIVPPGTFLSGPIELRSNMVLHVAAGAMILFHHDIATHPLVESRWAGTELHMYSPLVFGKDLENVAVTGRGVFDGNPQVWWDYFNACNKAGDREPICDRGRELAGLNKGRYEDTDCGGSGLRSKCLRPPLMELNNCRNVRHASGLVIRNSRFSIAHGPAMTFEESGEVELRNVRLDAREDGAEDIVANNSTIIR